jgi:hypothetical protein
MMNASQLRYLDIVILARNIKFASFYIPKVGKMLQKCPNHHFGCLASFFIPKVSGKLQNTLNDFGSVGVEWMLLLQNDLCNFGAKK